MSNKCTWRIIDCAISLNYNVSRENSNFTSHIKTLIIRCSRNCCSKVIKCQWSNEYKISSCFIVWFNGCILRMIPLCSGRSKSKQVSCDPIKVCCNGYSICSLLSYSKKSGVSWSCLSKKFNLTDIKYLFVSKLNSTIHYLVRSIRVSKKGNWCFFCIWSRISSN